MKRIYLALSILILASMACSALNVTTDTPSQPDNPSNPVIPSRETLYQDDFSDSSSGWPVAGDADKAASYSADGQYNITVIATQQDVWAHPGQNFSEVSIEVDATMASGPENNGFGIVCRFQDNDNFYYFMVSSDGYQVIGKYEGGENKYLTADKMQPTGAINAGNATNKLRGDCTGSTLTLYANGQQLSQATDTSFTSGDIGLIVGTFDDPNVSVNFDNFVVYKP